MTSLLIRTTLGITLALLVGVGCYTPSSNTSSSADRDMGDEADAGNLNKRNLADGSEDSSPGDLRTVYFGYDAYSLSSDSRQLLRHNAAILQQNKNAKLEIQGNCDERGTEEYNLALGKRRAESAKRYLVDLGIPANRLTTVSFGEENPAVRGHNEAAWAQNRRDDFVLR